MHQIGRDLGFSARLLEGRRTLPRRAYSSSRSIPRVRFERMNAVGQ
jgi:hypothetical protein